MNIFYQKVIKSEFMHGEIIKGDSIKFLVELADWDVPPTVFYITVHLLVTPLNEPGSAGNHEFSVKYHKIL